MPFDAILGNRTALERLHGAAARNKMAHAYLLAGPSGVGKRMAAIEFARSLICANGGCGACADCRQVAASRHPCLYTIQHQDTAAIKIEQFRDIKTGEGLLRDLAYKPQNRQQRVVVIDEAERMTDEAQNCILKTLEEPPAQCLFILISASPALLLPTIVSRCQTILFMPLSEEDVVAFARERLSLDATSAALVARLAAGSPGRASDLAKDATELKERAAELLASVAAGELNAVVERISKIRDTEQARERAREQLTLLAFAMREILRHRATGATPDKHLAPEGIVKRLAEADVEQLANRIETILDHLRMIDQNANVPLTVEDAMLRI